MNVEIAVQRNARPTVALREIQDLGIFRPLQSDLTGMHRIPTGEARPMCAEPGPDPIQP